MKRYHGYMGLTCTCIGAHICMSRTWTIQPKAVALPHANRPSDMHACEKGRCTLAHSLCSQSPCRAEGAMQYSMLYTEYSMAGRDALSLSRAHAIYQHTSHATPATHAGVHTWVRAFFSRCVRLWCAGHCAWGGLGVRVFEVCTLVVCWALRLGFFRV